MDDELAATGKSLRVQPPGRQSARLGPMEAQRSFDSCSLAQSIGGPTPINIQVEASELLAVTALQ